MIYCTHNLNLIERRISIKTTVDNPKSGWLERSLTIVFEKEIEMMIFERIMQSDYVVADFVADTDTFETTTEEVQHLLDQVCETLKGE